MSSPKKYYYLIHFQYLGFRYHGWQKQPGIKTVQLMMEKTINFILEHDSFRVLSASRTDSMVSANESACELFTKEPVDIQFLEKGLNNNLPSDIRVLKIEETDATFNIIQSSKQKEYVYLFSYGERFHPFSAPYMTFIQETLDLELMKEGAKLFIGEHNFKRFTSKPSEKTILVRTIDDCEIVENDLYTANFFPEKSYLIRVKGSGFIRYQIRFIAGTLFKLGTHQITLEDIKTALTGVGEQPLGYMAPASGLILNSIKFQA